MLNIRKDLNKLGIVSISSLMLLGVGASVTSASQNVHADNTNETEEQWEHDDSVPQATIRDEKHDAQEAVDYSKSHPSYARTAMNIVAQDHDINIKPYENILRPIANRYDAHHADDAATESQDKNNPKWWYRKAPIPPSRVSGSHNHKHAKKVNHHKHISRKRNRKHVSNLRKQINNLNKSQRSLRRRINRATHRKYRTRRAKRNARRYIAKLNQQYRSNNKQLRKLNRK